MWLIQPFAFPIKFFSLKVILASIIQFKFVFVDRLIPISLCGISMWLLLTGIFMILLKLRLTAILILIAFTQAFISRFCFP